MSDETYSHGGYRRPLGECAPSGIFVGETGEPYAFETDADILYGELSRELGYRQDSLFEVELASSQASQYHSRATPLPVSVNVDNLTTVESTPAPQVDHFQTQGNTVGYNSQNALDTGDGSSHGVIKSRRYEDLTAFEIEEAFSETCCKCEERSISDVWSRLKGECLVAGVTVCPDTIPRMGAIERHHRCNLVLASAKLAALTLTQAGNTDDKVVLTGSNRSAEEFAWEVMSSAAASGRGARGFYRDRTGT